MNWGDGTAFGDGAGGSSVVARVTRGVGEYHEYDDSVNLAYADDRYRWYP
jgi:hypothetical protein